MLYETVVIIRPELSLQQAEVLMQSFEPALSERGGVVKEREYGGLRHFAYPIRKYRKGHYFLLNLISSSDAVQEMCRLMRLSEDVLRFLNLSVEKHATLPTPLGQARYDRDERDQAPEPVSAPPAPEASHSTPAASEAQEAQS